MVGILLATHGHFANGIKESVNMLVGDVEKLDTLPLEEGMNINDFADNMMAKIDALDDGDGVLVMVDILGGSPFNASAMCIMKSDSCECITGLNLAMLLGALDMRDCMTLKNMTSELCTVGKDAVVNVRAKLGK